jgi:hypothetical protein
MEEEEKDYNRKLTIYVPGRAIRDELKRRRELIDQLQALNKNLAYEVADKINRAKVTIEEKYRTIFEKASKQRLKEHRQAQELLAKENKKALKEYQNNIKLKMIEDLKERNAKLTAENRELKSQLGKPQDEPEQAPQQKMSAKQQRHEEEHKVLQALRYFKHQQNTTNQSSDAYCILPENGGKPCQMFIELLRKYHFVLTQKLTTEIQFDDAEQTKDEHQKLPVGIQRLMCKRELEFRFAKEEIERLKNEILELKSQIGG